MNTATNSHETPSTSLTTLIKNLNADQKQRLEAKIHELYQKYRGVNDDDDWNFVERKIEPNIKKVIEIVNDYYNNGKSMDQLKETYNLTTFGLISHICDYCKQSGTLLRNIDLFNAIEYMQLEEKHLTDLVYLLLDERNLEPNEYLIESSALPSHMLLMLTIIYVELKNPRMASLFNQRWNEIRYQQFDPQEIEQEFKECMENVLEVLGLDGNRDNYMEEWNNALEEFNKTIDESKQSLSVHVQKHQKLMDEVAEVIEAFPKWKLQSILPEDTDEFAASLQEEIPEPFHTLRMSKKGYDFINGLLESENLAAQLDVQVGQLVFAKGIGSLNPSGFVGGNLIEKDDFSYKVEFMPGTSEQLVQSFGPGDLAVGSAPTVKCPEGTRVVAYFNPRLPSDPVVAGWYAGTVGKAPCIENRQEYLIFFDQPFDGYVEQCDIRLLLEQPMDGLKFYPRNAPLLVHTPKKLFLCDFFRYFPEWPLMKVNKGKRILATKNDQDTSGLVLEQDRSMVLVRFPPTKSWSNTRDCADINCRVHDHAGSDEWIYRGSPVRFPALKEYQKGMHAKGYADRRRMRNTRMNFDMAWPEYDTSAMRNNLEQEKMRLFPSDNRPQTARKSSARTPIVGVSSNVARELDPDVMEKQRKAKKVSLKFLPIPDWFQLPKLHSRSKQNKPCGPECLDYVDSSHLIDDPIYKVYSPYFKPLLYGWQRKIVRTTANSRSNMKFAVIYQTPCGIHLRGLREIGQYLELTKCEILAIDNFSEDFQLRVHALAQHGIEGTLIADDYTEGKEEMPISAVNAVSSEGLPDMTYRVSRYAFEPIVEETMNNQFCTGCSCTDNCSNPDKCECQRLTKEIYQRLARSIRNESNKPRYDFRTLQDRVKSGLYECNDACNCSKSRCFNRVAQYKIKVPLQLFMTPEIGWGVRTLVDLPKGAFISTYSGCIMTENKADELGREVGDKYLCDLDVAQAIDDEKKNQGILTCDNDLGYDSDELSSDGADESREVFAKNTHRRRRNNSSSEESPSENMETDEPVPSGNERPQRERQSARIMAQRIVQGGQGIALEDYFVNNGKPELFVVDAVQSGNIGRFLNHSCDPNVFIQSVFVDTHDIRLPWLGFYTYNNIQAGEELCWNYGYEIGSLPGRRIDCKCGATDCKGRLL